VSASGSNLAETKSLLLGMVAEAQELKSAAGGSVTDAVAGWLAPQYMQAAQKKLTATDGTGRYEALRTFVQDWALLRRGDHNAERLQIEREKLDEAKKTNQEKALELCLDESKSFRDVQNLFRAAFLELHKQQKGKQ
jgi:hypothetical protein